MIPALRSLWPDSLLGKLTDDPPKRAPRKRKRRAAKDGAVVDEGKPPPTASVKSASSPRARSYGREAAALLLIATGLYCALALGSFKADPMLVSVTGANWVGPVGEWFARSFVRLVGVVSWLVPLELVVLARPLFSDRRPQLNIARMSGDVLVCVIAAALVHIAFPMAAAFGNMPLGGAVGVLFGEIMRGLFSTVGSYLIGVTVVALILVERATFSFIELTQRVQAGFARARALADKLMGYISSAWRKARDLEQQRREEEQRLAEPVIASPDRADAIIAALADDGDEPLTPFVSARVRQRQHASSILPLDDQEQDDDDDAPTQKRPQVSRRAAAPQPRVTRPVSEESAVEPTEMPVEEEPPNSDRVHEALTPSPSNGAGPAAATPVPTAALEQEPAAKGASAVGQKVAAPASAETRGPAIVPPAAPPAPKPEQETNGAGVKIVDTSGAAKTRKASRRKLGQRDGEFELPSPELLERAAGERGGQSPEQLKDTATLLEKTLADYRVEGKVREIHPGPTVTMFEFSPAPGTKVSKVAGLADDLALGLSRKVRIVAPIPGKARIGFEVPNEKRIPVNLRELIESQEYQDLDVPLPCVLGRDIIGRPFFADLASMPHVIVAGATGAGKSVGLNVMLVSLLYRRTPEDLRLLMIDPKVVELAPFDKIPHLLFPVVTDMKQASNALKWTVDEMERRYQLFADAGTRNIKTYNQYTKKVQSGELALPPAPKLVEAVAPDGTLVDVPAAKDGSDAEMPRKLPYIVVIVEEFADLMMQQGKEVEASVARLAQKARAAGIHVILATQRPSVDVITGMIKANFPTRIAFRVSQKVDSRTILDQQGAEHLLGRGDMLVKLNGTNDVRRVQCPFASEDEVQRVTDMLRSQGEPEYDESIGRNRDAEEKGGDPSDAETDPLYDQACQIIADTQKCSTSWIQRKLGVGYNRAAKIVETMERNGLVGPPNGSKPREILISAH